MIDGNQLREEFGRYLAEHKATRWGMDAALMHVCKIAYDAGKADGPGAVLHSREYEIEVPVQPDMVEVERLIDAFGSSCNSVKKFGHIASFKPIGQQITERREARAALLAHIQRGAAPEGNDGKRVLREVFALCEDTEAKCYEDPSDFNRGRSFEAKGIARAIGAWYQEEFCGRTHMGEPAAPDHFRDAAEMVAAQKSLPSDVAAILADNMHLMYENGAPAAGTGAKPAEPERRIGPASDADMAVYQSIADGYSTRAPAPAGVPMPKPVAYGFGNTAITGHTNRLMMVRLDVPLDDQYAGVFWHPLVLADEAHAYGVACRAAGEAAGYARGLRDAVRGAVPLIQKGEVLVTVTGLTGSGKSAIAGEIEIMCRALGLNVEWVGGDAEKRLTHADWTDALEMYRPRVRIVEANIPRTDAALRGEAKP